MLTKELTAEYLNARTYETRQEMDAAATPSRNMMLKALLGQQFDFGPVDAFHMDEYDGLRISDPRSFYLQPF